MSIFEYDQEKHMRQEREQAYEEGWNAGQKAGEEAGKELGREEFSPLMVREREGPSAFARSKASASLEMSIKERVSQLDKLIADKNNRAIHKCLYFFKYIFIPQSK